MNLDKRYFSLEGKPQNILQMVKNEPEWAANRLQLGEIAIEILNDLLKDRRQGLLISERIELLNCSLDNYEKQTATHNRGF